MNDKRRTTDEEPAPLRTAIVGCGKIADQHVVAMRRAGGCELVALCDREVLMAEQLAERFGVPSSSCYADLGEMLAEARPDVVHVTTPPLGHFPIGKQCLEAGVHVYLEKPFTITAPEAEKLIDLAASKNLKLIAGHNLQFTPEMLAMREAVAGGFLAGKPVHLESHFPYGLGDSSYVAPILGDRNHWVRRLPGQLFHNILSHGVAKLAEFLDDGPYEIVAHASQSPELTSMGGGEVMDELRVLIRDASGTTAFFCFSTQLKPGLNLLKVFGPGGTLVVDHGNGTLLKQRAKSDKSYLTFFLPPLRAAAQNFGNGVRNIIAFLRRRLYQDAGMRALVAAFYESIRDGGVAPIPPREILTTARIMDRVFAQVYPPDSGRRHERDHANVYETAASTAASTTKS